IRLPFTLFEASFSFRRLRTTPARKPRTECCRHPVAFMMAATVVPVGDCSIAMTRACFEPALALLVLGSSANCREGFTALADNGDFAGDGFLADFDIEILDSVSRRRRAAPPKPRIGDKAGGAGSRSALAPKSDDSTAPIAVECQSFLRAVTTQFGDLQSRDIARHGQVRIALLPLARKLEPLTYLVRLRRRRALRRRGVLFLQHAAQRQPPFSRKYFRYSRQ